MRILRPLGIQRLRAGGRTASSDVSAGAAPVHEGSELVSKEKALSIRTARPAGHHPPHHTTFTPAAALIMADDGRQ